MESKEWPLVIFTIIAQLAMGMILMCVGFDWYLASKAGMETAQKVMQCVIFITAPLLIIGLLVSLLHLGHIEKAMKAFYNIRSSWLSRESLLMGLLTMLLSFLAILHIFGLISKEVIKPILWTATVISLVLVFCMSKIYMLRTVPAWNRNTTPIAFYATTILLGAVAYAVVCISGVSASQGEWLAEILSVVSILALFLVGIQSAVISIGLFTGDGEISPREGIVSGWKKHSCTVILRVVSVFAGLGFLGVALFTSLFFIVYFAFVLVLVSETAGRFFFYASHETVGI
jgi:anaerobic dimethyl sulfoxide reductase subunit C (anchor subunit)